MLHQDYAHLISASVRFFKFSSSSYLEYEEKRFNEKKLFFADSSLFRVFDFPLVKGNPTLALKDANQIVLTKAAARRYFGETDPIGKTIRYEGKLDLIVSGIIDDIPPNSHFSFNGLISFTTLRGLLTETQLTNFFWNPSYTYLLLNDRADDPAGRLRAELPAYMKKYFNEVKVANKKLHLQALEDLHLYSHYSNELEAGGNVGYIYILGTVGAMILIIAIINFINLSTSRTIHRTKEVGVRKVLGSSKGQLVRQLLTESILYTAVAMIVAVMLTTLTLPVLNGFLNKSISFHEVPAELWYSGIILMVFLVGVISGLYPALYLAQFDVMSVLRRTFKLQGSVLRKGLVVFQFTIAVTLVSGTIMVGRQLNFLQDAPTGFDREQIVIVPIQRSALSDIATFRAFRDRLLKDVRIRHVTAFEDMPGIGHNSGSYSPEGSEQSMLLPRLFVREDFLQTFSLKLVAGRNFNDAYLPDRTEQEVIINESMVRQLGWGSAEDAIGRKMSEYKRDTTTITIRVVGVVEDFHVTSLREPIKPFVLEGPPVDGRLNSFMIKYMAIKISANYLQDVLEGVENAWNGMVDDKVFEYSFLDSNLEAQYSSEQKFSQLIRVFSALAIGVACLGLVGLTFYTVERRAKEISIRKVLGSSTPGIVFLLSIEFLRLVFVSNVMAMPISWFAIGYWLNDFAYRVSFDWRVFAVGLLISLSTALFTVSFQTVKTAFANPARMLRME
jgi:putative ABC transport system permease protein